MKEGRKVLGLSGAQPISTPPQLVELLGHPGSDYIHGHPRHSGSSARAVLRDRARDPRVRPPPGCPAEPGWRGGIDPGDLVGGRRGLHHVHQLGKGRAPLSPHADPAREHRPGVEQCIHHDSGQTHPSDRSPEGRVGGADAAQVPHAVDQPERAGPLAETAVYLVILAVYVGRDRASDSDASGAWQHQEGASESATAPARAGRWWCRLRPGRGRSRDRTRSEPAGRWGARRVPRHSVRRRRSCCRVRAPVRRAGRRRGLRPRARQRSVGSTSGPRTTSSDPNRTAHAPSLQAWATPATNMTNQSSAIVCRNRSLSSNCSGDPPWPPPFSAMRRTNATKTGSRLSRSTNPDLGRPSS